MQTTKYAILAAALAVAVASCACPCGQDAESLAEKAPWQVARPHVTAVREGPVFNVAKYGVKTDGTITTKELQAVLDACAKAGGGVVVIPAGNYLTGSLVIGSYTTLQIEKGATLAATRELAEFPIIQGRWEGSTTPVHRALLSAEGAQEIAITGEGTVAGNAAVTGGRPPRMVLGQVTIPARGDGARGACVIEFSHCKDVRIEGVTLHQNGVWTTHPVYSQDVLYRNVTFETTGGNSDGIDVDSSARVWIDHCSFVNGDDSIALKSGKGDEGRKSPPTEDVLITDCVFKTNRFAAVATGSECAGGVRRVQIERCDFQAGMAFALRMKTSDGRGGFIDDVRVRDVTSTAQRFMQVTMNVNNPDPEPLGGVEGITRVGGYDLEGVKLSGGFFLDVVGKADRPVMGLRVHNVTGTCTRAMVIENARNVDLAGIEITGFTGPRLAVVNAQGAGLEGATTQTGR